MVSISKHSIVHTLLRIYSDVHTPCKPTIIHEVSRDSALYLLENVYDDHINNHNSIDKTRYSTKTTALFYDFYID